MNLKYIIEPLTDDTCRLTGLDASELEGEKLKEFAFPTEVTQDGRTYRVTELGEKLLNVEQGKSDAKLYAALHGVTRAIVPEGIEALQGTFCNNRQIRAVELPESLRVIGDYAFKDCRSLESCNIPDGVVEIGREAFYQCTHLLRLETLPSGLKKIGENALIDMLKPQREEGAPLPPLVLPDTIEKVGASFIEGKYSSLVAPAHIYPQLGEVKTEEGHTTHTLYDCSFEEVDVPEGVTEIPRNMLEYNHDLKRVHLPSTLRVIGYAAFHYCNRIEEINLPEGLEEIGESAFEDTPALLHTTIPASVKRIGKRAFVHDTMEGERKTTEPVTVELRETTEYDKGIFAYYHNITFTGNAEALAKVSAVPGFFNGCGVTEITIPEGTTEVEVHECPNLTSLTLPDGVESIDIYNLPEVKQLTLPGSIEKVEGFKYMQCAIDASLKVWQMLALAEYGLDGYKADSLVIPEGVTELGNEFLNGCELNSITLPSTLEKIGPSAFFRAKIEEIEIPSGVKLIGDGAFCGCSAKTYKFNIGLEQVDDGAFYGCKATKLEFPDGMLYVGEDVVRDSETVEELSFPASMQTYKDNFAYRCPSLKSIIFRATDAETAVFPMMTGKLCEWYVADDLVAHVKKLIDDYKKANPFAKGVGAKKILPLSKLTGEAPAAEPAPKKSKKAAAPAGDPMAELTVEERLVCYGRLDMRLAFPITTDMEPMLKDKVQTIALFGYLMNNRADQMRVLKCNFAIPRVKHIESGELLGETQDKRKIYDFNDKIQMPANFPEAFKPTMEAIAAFNALPGSQQDYSQYPSFFTLPNEGYGDHERLLVMEYSAPTDFEYIIRRAPKRKFSMRKMNVLSSRKDDLRVYPGVIYDGWWFPLTAITSTSVMGNDFSYKLYIATKGESKFEEMPDPTIEGISNVRLVLNEKRLPDSLAAELLKQSQAK